jgi:hypothetical protein
MNHRQTVNDNASLGQLDTHALQNARIDFDQSQRGSRPISPPLMAHFLASYHRPGNPAELRNIPAASFGPIDRP